MSVAEPTFDRVAGTDLYWLVGAEQTIGFLATPHAGLGDAPALSATWADAGGTYVLVPAGPGGEPFATALKAYLRGAGVARVLWVHDPRAPVSRWRADALTVSAGVQIARRADLRLDRYVLSLPAGAALTLAAAEPDWGIAVAGAARFLAPGGAYPVREDAVLLAFSGDAPGALRFAIDLDHGAERPTDFERLDAGLRFCFPDPDRPPPPATSANGSNGAAPSAFARALDLPAIVQPHDAVMTLHASLDVLHPLDPARTHLSFFAPGSTTVPPTLGSTFATAQGHQVELTPEPGSPPARFVLAEQPRFVGADGRVPTTYYLTLEGSFRIGWKRELAGAVDSTGAVIYRLLCGASGLEYLGMPEAATSRLTFHPGRPAYSPLRPTDEDDAPALEDTATTAWVYASADAGEVRYYAQPEEAPLFAAPDADAQVGTEFLKFLEVPAVRLPAPGPGRAFPIAPYRGLRAHDVAAAEAMERGAVAPARRRALDAIAAGGPSPRLPTATVGVTPQGFAVGLAADGMTWTWLGIANDGVAGAPAPDLAFTRIDGRFRQAIQTNGLFMVMANAGELARCGSIAYQLTAAGIAELAAADVVPPAILDPVSAAFARAGYPVYETEDDFVAALVAASPGARDFALQFERQAGLLTPTIADWTFQMSPRNWLNPDRVGHPYGLVVFKLARGRSLRELTDDLTAWTWPEVSAPDTRTPADTQGELRSIYADAQEAYERTSAGGRESPYADFVRMVDDPDWTGIVALSVDVPLRDLPEPLQALAAGIDADRFYAHHVGFNVTPFGADPGRLSFERTSMFGLIDYQDPEDQYFSENVEYAFKVLRLTAGFRNSALTSFSSRVELLVNRLLGAETRLHPTEHGNNVVLDGVFQKQVMPDGSEHGTYVFSMVEQNTLGLQSGALRWVVLSSTQLVTAQAADPRNPDSEVVARFVMGGDLHFYEPAPFDVFSFGAYPEPGGPDDSSLRFGGLAVEMRFTLAERTPSFALVTETLSFDVVNSTPRPASLFARFPLVLSGFVAPAASTDPSALGYVSVDAPIQQAKLTDPWYGLIFDIDLGSLGALSGSRALKLQVLAAWSGDDDGDYDDPPAYVGVKLPGVKEAVGVELPLQGVITLGFRSIQFLVLGEADKREYLLRLRNFALRFFGIGLPPGNNDVYLFGNPDQTAAAKLGWYAAYSAELDPKKPQLTAAGPWLGEPERGER